MLRMSFGSQFQTFGTAAYNTRLLVSVQVHAKRDGGERQWTAETASSLVAVVVRRCVEERKSTGSW